MSILMMRVLKKRFQQINEANEVLSDTDKRKKYDEYGENWQHADAYKKANKQSTHRNSSQDFGRNNSQHYSSDGFEGEDFSEFFGSMFGRAGSRQRQSTQFRGQDFNATLKLTEKEVYTTQKQLLTVNSKKIRITIPAGVENGQTIKIKGYGSEGVNGGPKGDLYITFNIIPDN